MKLIIDIPEEQYKTLNAKTQKDVIAAVDNKMIMNAVKNGTPLSESGDCVSRQAVLDLAKFDGRENLGSIIHAFDVERLPPVTPAEKVGQWEYVQYDGNPNIGNWHCSECRAIVNYTPTYNWEKKPYHKFCPNCGAKMSEIPTGSERSDKE